MKKETSLDIDKENGFSIIVRENGHWTVQKMDKQFAMK